MRQQILLMMSPLMVLAADAQGLTKAAFTARGRVVDESGRAVAGATVEAYELKYGSHGLEMQQLGKVITESDGGFRLGTAYATMGNLVAYKDGLALDFVGLTRFRGDREITFRLGQARTLRGVVVDEKDQPIPGAEVRAFLTGQGSHREIAGLPDLDRLATTTDADGKFRFAGIPGSAKAEFAAQAPGYARILTHKASGRQGYKFVPGGKQARIILPPEVKIEGVTTDKRTGKPAPGVRLLVRRANAVTHWDGIAAVSGTDGRFSVGSLLAGTYSLEVIRVQEGGYANWVPTARAVSVTAKASKTPASAKVQVSKGAVLIIGVTDAITKAPLVGVTIAILDIGEKRKRVVNELHFRTGKDGTARIRLPAWHFALSRVIAKGYADPKIDIQLSPADLSEGTTKHVNVQMTPSSMVPGPDDF